MCNHVDKSLESCLHRTENPISFERKLAVSETTTALDGSRVLIRPSMRLHPRKPGVPETQERRKQVLNRESKMVHMALGNMPLKQNFSFENASF